MYVILKNLGVTAHNVEAALISYDTTITLIDSYAFYGTLLGEDTSGIPFTFLDTFNVRIGLPTYLLGHLMTLNPDWIYGLQEVQINGRLRMNPTIYRIIVLQIHPMEVMATMSIPIESDGYIFCDGWYIDDVEIQKDVSIQEIHLILQGRFFSDETGGNGDGIIDPGETIEVWFP